MFGEGPAQAFRNAARLMAETGAGAVKLEGGVEMAETIRFLVKRGIPVMAHIGLTPQSINTLGGYKVQGRDAQAEAPADGRLAHALGRALLDLGDPTAASRPLTQARRALPEDAALEPDLARLSRAHEDRP